MFRILLHKLRHPEPELKPKEDYLKAMKTYVILPEFYSVFFLFLGCGLENILARQKRHLLKYISVNLIC